MDLLSHPVIVWRASWWTVRQGPIRTKQWSSWGLRKASSSSSLPRWTMVFSMTACFWRNSMSTTLTSESLLLGMYVQKHMDTVATNEWSSLHMCAWWECAYVFLHVSNHLQTWPTHQPTSSISTSQLPWPRLYSQASQPDGYSII